jgi:hypothetical protein
VLKFISELEENRYLAREKEMWGLLYSEFSHLVKLERWSGADTLTMTHFSLCFQKNENVSGGRVKEFMMSKRERKSALKFRLAQHSEI